VVANAQLESLGEPPAPHLFQPIEQGDYTRNSEVSGRERIQS
jgi:hypothetical protein